MKKGFQKLASIASEDTARNNNHEGELIDDQQLDSLGELLRTSKMAAARYIILAAKLLAPVIDKDIATGYDWMIESVKTSPNSEMASELELEKSIYYLKNRDFQLAINCLKGFERKDKSFVRVAATNLSFLYYLGGDFENSELYADVAVENDRYNSKAQTNKGNIYFAKGES
jgi:intraflagellar transport protein 88